MSLLALYLRGTKISCLLQAIYIYIYIIFDLDATPFKNLFCYTKANFYPERKKPPKNVITEGRLLYADNCEYKEMYILNW